jgi:hypothetical protein
MIFLRITGYPYVLRYNHHNDYQAGIWLPSDGSAQYLEFDVNIKLQTTSYYPQLSYVPIIQYIDRQLDIFPDELKKFR